MAFQPVPDTVAIDIIYSQNGATIQNVFYAELVGGYTLPDLVALAAGIDGQVQGTWKAQQNANSLYLRTEVTGLAVINDLFTSNNTNTGFGVLAGGPLPNNVTFAIKKSSGLTGRSARGRTYWIGIPLTELEPTDENTLKAPYVTAIVAAVDSIRTQINALSPWVPVLVSRFTGGSQRTEGETFLWVSTLAVGDQIDTQRGRMP